MPLVVVALARQGAPVRELQIPLGPLQCLDRRFFIDTENNRLGRRVNIETHNIGSFRRELRVIALAPGLAGGQIDIVFAQEAPNILNVNIPQRLGQQRTRPSGIALRWRLIQKRQNAPVGRRTVDRLLVGAQAVLKSSKAVIGKTPPPFADDTRLNTHFLSDRARAAALSRQRDYPRTRHLALWRAWPRQRASSTLRTFDGSRTSLALGIIPILNHDSPAKKSGY